MTKFHQSFNGLGISSASGTAPDHHVKHALTGAEFLMNWTFYPVGQYEDFRSQWAALNTSGVNTPLLDPDFFFPLIETFATGKERIAICGDPAAPEAIGIFTPVRALGWTTFQPLQSPVSAWLTRTPAFDEAMLLSLAKALPGITLLLAISQQDPALAARPTDSARLATLDYIPTAHIKVAGTFEDYWAGRGKNLRHNIKRQRNRLKRESVETRLEWLTAPEDMAGAVRDHGNLESAGWKLDAGGAIHADNAQGAAYRALLGNFARRGKAIVMRYFYGDTLVASDLCISDDRQLIVLKTAYDESQQATSPAHLMRHEAYTRVFADQAVERIEFYGRAMDWHRKWTDDIRTMYHVNFYPWPLFKTLHTMLKKRGADEK